MFGDRKVFECRNDRLVRLEKEMVERVMEDGTREEIIEVHQLILEAERIRNDYVAPTSSNWFSSMLGFIVWAIFLATAISFVAYIPCLHSKSRFCENSQIIPNYIISAFKEP